MYRSVSEFIATVVIILLQAQNPPTAEPSNTESGPLNKSMTITKFLTLDESAIPRIVVMLLWFFVFMCAGFRLLWYHWLAIVIVFAVIIIVLAPAAICLVHYFRKYGILSIE